MKLLQNIWDFFKWLLDGWKASEEENDEEYMLASDSASVGGKMEPKLKIWKTTYPDGHNENGWDLADYINLRKH